MRTKLSAWYKLDFDEVWYGVIVYAGGKWCNLAENSVACIYQTRAEAEQKRQQARRLNYLPKRSPEGLRLTPRAADGG